jgi:glycosyltransferase involved in cell wall biosynthesis
MHTLLIHQAFTTPNDAGGTRHYELARHVVGNGGHISVVTGDFGYLSGARYTQKAVGDENVDGIRVLRAATTKSLHGGLFAQLLSLLSFSATSFLTALRVRDIDVVMGTSPPIFQAVTACAVAAIRRRPFLLEIRDLWPEFIIDMGKLRNPIVIRASRWLERFLYRRADRLLVNSPAYVDYLAEMGVPRDRISFIPNGVDPAMFSNDAASGAAAAEIRRRFALDGKFVVLYSGAMGPANDLGVLLDAAQVLRGDERIHFLLVGGGKECARLEARASELALPNVTFAGVQPKELMRGFLESADLCVATLQNIAMFRMTYPNKVFDYLAAGKPVALAIDGVIRHVVEEAKAGLFVQPGSPRALADVVLELAADPKRAAAMGARGRTYVSRHFNRAQHAAEFLTLLRETAARR